MQHPTIKYKLEPYIKKLGKRLDVDFTPTRAHDTDAGADLRIPIDVLLDPLHSVEIDTGVHVQLPPNTKGEIKSKSGLFVKHGIITTGLIDEGFTNTIRVRIVNLGYEPYNFRAGDKLTQLCVSPVLYPTYIESDNIEGGERGDNGYGSTGKR